MDNVELMLFIREYFFMEKNVAFFDIFFLDFSCFFSLLAEFRYVALPGRFRFFRFRPNVGCGCTPPCKVAVAGNMPLHFDIGDLVATRRRCRGGSLPFATRRSSPVKRSCVGVGS